jgi:hypothetical protein
MAMGTVVATATEMATATVAVMGTATEMGTIAVPLLMPVMTNLRVTHLVRSMTF